MIERGARAMFEADELDREITTKIPRMRWEDLGPTYQERWRERMRVAASLLRSELLDCALYDATMEGPAFKGWNQSALNRLRRAYEQF